ncbi:hypothetical protein SUGI_0223240 [Cryptomeria japonica]|uniref:PLASMODESMATA CALLOSE-BINDING PROTEIN 4 n=1 Tax=Cryptomeria japonica TaxID=3369 RepID=UPI002408B009|nr:PLASMODESMATA CALLOSE-BINDING PROTEIN 4 [Cryptomeria japonica]XP_057815608.2 PLASMODESMATA CALLOSE-BINDING PROTEIN 4 [Cryptomeria japonica]GLJ13958.1 hypothetical protein SUGI_0223240 [Cryptomeria japonica]
MKMTMELRFVFVLLLLSVYGSGLGDGRGKYVGEQNGSKHLGLAKRKLSEKKTSSNSTAKPTDFGVGTPTPPTYVNPITTPTTPTITPTTPTTPVTTPTTPVTTPTTPVTTPTTPVTTPTTPVTSPALAGQSWCVAKTNVADKSLQTALDYACGLGGADCKAIVKGGQCFDPNTVAAHASYAFNSYYQKNNMASGTCDFGGNAIITQTNPSYGTCVYTTGSSTGTPTTPTTPVTTPTTPVTTPTTPVTTPTTPTPVTTPTTPVTTPTTPVTTPTTPTTTPVYNSSSPVGGITTPTGGITGIPTSLGPSSSFNTTSYSGTSSSFTYLGSSLTLLMGVGVAVIL